MAVYKNNQVKKGKLKMFFVFLLCTTFIWFLTKFSKEYTATIDATVQYSNIPKGVHISEDNYKTVSFDVSASGFDFLFYKINHPEIVIKIDQFYKKGTQEVIISKNNFSKLITAQLNKNIAVRNMSIEEMKIKLDQIETKRVPIRLQSDVLFEKGYKAIEGIIINPKFIDISGPSSLIDSITEVTTKLVKYKNLKSDISEKIALTISDKKEVSYSIQNVQLSIIVKEFTQKKLTLPIFVKNLPSEVELKIIPERVTITFDVSMDEFNKIKESDFSVICDYKNRNESESFMIPEILKMPKRIVNIEIKENRIKYLIFK